MSLKRYREEEEQIENFSLDEELRVLDGKDLHDLVQKESWNSRDLQDTPLLDHKTWVKEHGSCHLNLIIPDLKDDQHTREFIFYWSKRILEAIAKSKNRSSAV